VPASGVAVAKARIAHRSSSPAKTIPAP
jgi:hypothetical protein